MPMCSLHHVKLDFCCVYSTPVVTSYNNDDNNDNNSNINIIYYLASNLYLFICSFIHSKRQSCTCLDPSLIHISFWASPTLGLLSGQFKNHCSQILDWKMCWRLYSYITKLNLGINMGVWWLRQLTSKPSLFMAYPNCF